MSASVVCASAHREAEASVPLSKTALSGSAARPVSFDGPSPSRHSHDDVHSVDLRCKAQFARIVLRSHGLVDPEGLGSCCQDLKTAIREYISSPEKTETVNWVRVVAGSTIYCLGSWTALIQAILDERTADSNILRNAVLSPVADSGGRLIEIGEKIAPRSQLNGSFDQVKRLLEDFSNRLIPMLESIPEKFEEARSSTTPKAA